MAQRRDQLVQRDLHFAIIDEVDNILIDEARTPLIISGHQAFVKQQQQDVAYKVQTQDAGYQTVKREKGKGTEPVSYTHLYDPRFYHLTYYLENSLRAQYLFKRDVDYVCLLYTSRCV